MRGRVPAVAGVLLGGVFLAGAAIQDASPPAFPARTGLVTGDVALLDGDGRSVTGLHKKEDFTVLEGGRPQEAPPVAEAKAGAGPGGTAPAPEAPASTGAPHAVVEFATQAEAITVDVVVLDKSGHPVGGLEKSDFTVLEDGRQQTIVGFEPKELADAKPDGEADPAVTAGVASNEAHPVQEGRTLAFLVDDLGIQPGTMPSTVRALASWLAKDADPRDQVTLATSSGDAWWSATVGEGREDFAAVLQRLKGRKAIALGRDWMSDYEAYSINAHATFTEKDSFGLGETGVRYGGGCFSTAQIRDVIDRVTDRWFANGTCLCNTTYTSGSIAVCRSLARGQAKEVYAAATRRAVVLLAGVERLSRGLAPSHGRKSIVVLSEGLLQETDQRAVERAIDASRHGNTVASFVDVRGLLGQPLWGADQRGVPDVRDVGTMMVEMTQGETEGADSLTERTGGSVYRNSNDVAGALSRVAEQSSVYYLLGYQTDRPLDGKWRRLQVKVSRPNLTVRARRGYYATAQPPTVEVPKPEKRTKREKREKGDKKQDALPVRPLDPVLLVGTRRDEILLRMAPYLFETDTTGQVRVLVAVEVNTVGLSFTGAGKERTAKLDLTVLGISRDQASWTPLDSRVELTTDRATEGSWWRVWRELRLPPGPAQLRVLVRDAASGRSGLVAQRVEIPSGRTPYLSTPVLTEVSSKRAAGTKIVPTAHRRFPARGFLYCAYEVYAEPGRELSVVPQVRSSYTLTDDSGRIVASEQPSVIGVALGGTVARVHAIPLAALAPGRYQLAIQAVDEAHGIDLRWSDGFVVEPPAGAQPPAGGLVSH